MVTTMMWQCHLSSSECRCYRLNGFSLFKRLPIPLSSGSRTLEQSVGEWLESIGLQQYESKLLLNGFDDVRFLVSAADVLAQAEVGKSTESFTLGESQPRGCGHPEVRWVAEANFADRPGPATCGPSATQREHTWDPDSHPGPSLVS